MDIAASVAAPEFRPVGCEKRATRPVILFSLVLFAVMVAQAQNPLRVEPAHFKVQFQNDQVQVVRLHFGPHYRSVMNQTSARVVVIFTDAHFRVTDPDDVSVEQHLKAGTGFWSEGGKGIPENLSAKPFEILWLVPKVQPTSQTRSGQPRAWRSQDPNPPLRWSKIPGVMSLLPMSQLQVSTGGQNRGH